MPTKTIRLVPAVAAAQKSFFFQFEMELEDAVFTKLEADAKAAGRGQGAAPSLRPAGFVWAADNPQPQRLTLFGTEFAIPKPSDATSLAGISIHASVGLAPEQPSGVLCLQILSGAIEFALDSQDWQVPAGLEERLARIWPGVDSFKLVRLVLQRSGLAAHVEGDADAGNARRVYQLDLPDSEPAGIPRRLRWRQIVWPLNLGGDPSYEQPSDRLKSLKRFVESLSKSEAFQVVERLSDANTGSVCVEVDTNSGGPKAVEVFQPGWSLHIRGTTWKPQAVRLSGNRLRLTDGEYALIDDVVADADTTDARVAWDEQGRATAENLPRLGSTGQTTGGGANLPYVWQYGPIQEAGTQRGEPAVWVRYRLDPRARTATPAAAREGLEAAGLSSSIEITLANQWQLDVSPLSPSNGELTAARIDLALEFQGDADKILAGATLTIRHALVRALAPGIQIYRPRLADAAAVPNAASLIDVISPARLEFASDVAVPVDSGAARADCGLTIENQTLQIKAASPDCVVAFVAGPEAGVSLVSWSGGNLQRQPVEPGQRGAATSSVSRDYNQGLVPLRIEWFSFQSAENSTGLFGTTVAIAIEKSIPVPTEATAALLPWTSWTQPGQVDGAVTHQAFHRNRIQEDSEWEIASVDQARHLVEPQANPADPDVDRWSDLRRRQEDLQDVENGIRDQFATAVSTDTGLSTPKRVENWLDQVDFDGGDFQPEWKLEPAADPTTLPKLSLPAGSQTLALAADGGAPRGWLRTHLKWPVPESEPASEARRQLTLQSDASTGAFLADGSSAAVLHRYSDIVAMDAVMFLGRLFVFFGDARGRLYHWEPLAKIGISGPAEFGKVSTGVVRSISAIGLDEAERVFAVVAEPRAVTAYPFDIQGGGLNLLPSNGVAIVSPSPASMEITCTSARVLESKAFVFWGSAGKFSIFKVDDTSASSFFEDAQVGGTVRQITVRKVREDLFSICVGVETSDGDRIRIYEWEPSFVSDPTRHPGGAGASKTEILTVENGGLRGLVIQPVRPSDAKHWLHVFAAVVQDDTNRFCRWVLSKEDVAAPLKMVVGQEELKLEGSQGLALSSLAMDAAAQPSKYLVAGAQGSARDATAQVCRWAIDWPESEDPVTSAPRATSISAGGGHLGTITAAAVVCDPGAEYLVTASRDGTVRLWDAASCQELRRCTAPQQDPRWMDNLGVERCQLLVDSEVWRVESLSVPHPDPGRRAELRSISTKAPVQLTTDGQDTDIRFSCLDVKLESLGGEAWKPAAEPCVEQGCYGVYSNSEAEPKKWPRLCGAAIYVVRLESVALDADGPKHLVLQAVLANPAELAQLQTEELVPALVAEAVAAQKLLTLSFARQLDGTFKLAVPAEGLGRFLWRFDLADQTPAEASLSAFPGRLAELTGAVKWDEEGKTLLLEPDKEECVASALGRLWKLDDCPNLKLAARTPSGEQFRDTLGSGERMLEKRRDLAFEANSPTIVLGRSRGRAEALTACAPNERDTVVRWDVETALEKARYSEAVRTGVLSVFRTQQGTTSKERLDALLVYADGSAGLWYLQQHSKVDLGDWTDEPIAPREWNRYRLDSPIEAVDVLETTTKHQDGTGTHRYLLFRCANGTAELWDEVGGRLHEFVLPEAAVTVAVFGPSVSASAVPAHWKASGLLEQGKDVLLAIGGSDGSVRVYVHSPDASATRPVREFFDHREPITSLGLAIHNNVPEAGSKAGLYLVVTSGVAGRPQLVELVTENRSHDDAGESDNSPHSCREFGDLVKALSVSWAAVRKFGDTVLILFRCLQPGGGASLKYCTRQDPAEGKVFTELKPLPALEPVTLVPGSYVEQSIFVAGVIEDGVKVIRFQSGGANPDATPEVLADSAGCIPVSVRSFGGREQILGFRSDTGRPQFWKQQDGAQNTWAGPTAPIPKQDAIAATGFVDVPVPLLIRTGRSGGVTVWDPELDCLRYRIPRELAGRPEAPRAFAILQGVPHLAVAEKSVVRLWNLDTGEQVHAFLHDSDVAEVDLAWDRGTAWLLAREVPKSKAVTLWNVDKLERKSAGTADKVRFAAEPDGLQVITVLRDGTNLKLMCVAVGTNVDPITVPLPADVQVANSIADVSTLTLGSGASRKQWALIELGVEAPERSIAVVVVDRSTPSRVWSFPAASTNFYQASTWLSPREAGGPLPRFLVVDKAWKTHICELQENAAPDPPRTVTPTTVDTKPPGGPQDGDTPSAVVRCQLDDGLFRLLVVGARNRASLWEVTDGDSPQPVAVREIGSDETGSLEACVALVPSVFAADEQGPLVFWERESGQRRLAQGPADIADGADGKLVFARASQDLARPLVVCGMEKGTRLLDLVTQTWTAVTNCDGDQAVIAGAGSIHTISGKLTLCLAEAVQQAADSTTSTLRHSEFDLGTWAPAATSPQQPAISLGTDVRLDLAVLSSGNPFVLAASEAKALHVLKWETPASGGRITLSKESTSLAAVLSVSDAVLYVAATDGESLKLWELPGGLPAGDVTADGPWTVPESYSGVAIMGTPEGPQILVGSGKAGACVYAPRRLLRVRRDPVPAFDVPITLFRQGDLRLQGYINPARRLEVTLHKAGRGLPETVPLQSAIVQSEYYGYLIDTADLAGFLVCWDAKTASGMSGVVVVEERPPASESETQSAALKLAGAAGIDLRGLRRRMQAFGFSSEASQQRTIEVLSWELAGRLGEQTIRLQIDDQLLAWEGDSPLDSNKVILGHLRVSQGNGSTAGDLFQGYVPLSVTKADDEYTFTVMDSVFAVAGKYQALSSGVTRDDVVFPLYRSADNLLRGRAFDLVETQPDPAAANRPVEFVTLAKDATGLVLKKVDFDGLPLDRALPPDAFQLADRLPQALPPLVHRHARGAQLRVCLPQVAACLTGSASVESLEAGRRLLQLLIGTPDGVKILADSLVFRAGARRRVWERSQMESLLCVHRGGDRAFGTAALLGNGASVGTLLTRCLELGATADAALLLDDHSIRDHLLATGADGVAVARVLDGDGHLSYRFVNSPFHSLQTTRPTAKPEQKASSGAGDEETPELDPLQLTPGQAAAWDFQPSNRYRPVRPVPFPVLAGNETAQDAVALLRHLRYEGEWRKELDPTKASLHLDEITAFRGRPARGVPSWNGSAAAGNGRVRFLPREFDLRYGIDKPGAMFHHTARILSQSSLNDSKQAGGLAELALREPQRFRPPAGAGVRIEPLKIQQDKTLPAGLKRILVEWTETLGELPVSDLVLSQEVSVQPPADSGTKYSLADRRILAFVVRIGEQLFRSTIDDRLLYVPRIEQSGNRFPNGYELYVLARADLTASQSITISSGEVAGRLHVIVTDGDGASRTIHNSARFDEVFAKVSDGSPSPSFQLFRAKDRLLSLIDPTPSGPPSSLGLDIAWAADDNSIDYANMARVFSADCPSLRFVDIRQAAPRVAAVLRHPQPSWLNANRERTLFYGKSASARQAAVPSLVDADGRISLRLEAKDHESLVLAWPEGEPTLFFVKYYDTGEAILAVPLSS